MREHDYWATPPGGSSPARSLLPIDLGVLLLLALALGGYMLVTRPSSPPDGATAQNTTAEAPQSAVGAARLDPHDIVDVIPMDWIPAIDEPRFETVVDNKTLSFATQGGEIVDLETRSTWNLFGRAIEGPLEGRSLRPVDATDSFWFDWAAFHPETKIWQGS